MMYVVKADYTKYVFDDRNTAMTFAALAKTKAVEPITVTIEIVHEEELDK